MSNMLDRSVYSHLLTNFELMLLVNLACHHLKAWWWLLPWSCGVFLTISVRNVGKYSQIRMFMITNATPKIETSRSKPT